MLVGHSEYPVVFIAAQINDERLSMQSITVDGESHRPMQLNPKGLKWMEGPVSERPTKYYIWIGPVRRTARYCLQATPFSNAASNILTEIRI